MTVTSPEPVDFFVSYNGNDEGWAEWIAWQVENAGFSVVIQAWDFRPGSNFVLEMDKATKSAKRTIVVLSPNYLNSQFVQPEWATAFAKDPTGAKGLVVPVQVAECDVEGILGPVIHINLVGLSKDAAAVKLLAGLQPGRSKPTEPPAFPGVETSSRSPMATPVHVPAGLDWKSVVAAPAVVWRKDLRDISTSGYTVVELQLVPLTDSLLPVRKLGAIPEELATAGRQSGLFTAAQRLVTDSGADVAYAKSATDRDSDEAGLLISRRGQRGAWIALPHDMLGSVLDAEELTARLTSVLSLLLSLDIPIADRYGITARIGPLMMLTLGDKNVIGNRNSASMSLSGHDDITLPVEDSVAGEAIKSNLEEVAAEIVARLISRTKP